MDQARFLRVRNYEKFQRFNRDNLKQKPNPDWIKLYYSLLADRMFYRLPDHQKFHVIGMFLIASQHDNKIPADVDWLQHQMAATEKINLDTLLNSRFVEWVEPSGPSTPTVTEIVDKAKDAVAPVEEPPVEEAALSPLNPRKSVFGDNQIREEKKRIEKKREEYTARRSRAPKHLEITDEMRQWAQENGIAVDLEAETAAMLDHHRGKGNLHLDWVATWRTWMRNNQKWNSSKPTTRHVHTSVCREPGGCRFA